MNTITTTSQSLLLLGDSIIDNKVYLANNQLSTDEQLIHAFPNTEVLMHAVDGYVTQHVIDKVKRLGKNTTLAPARIILSTGGNDALNFMRFIESPVKNIAEGILAAGEYVDRFEQDYHTLIELITTTWPRAELTVLTIYEGNLGGLNMKTFARRGIRMYNDVIQRAARKYNLELIELREFFTNAEHYANPIEPSAKGSRLIAERFVELTQVRVGVP